jgi:prepilin-type N-terminal cleavage/methylation domain-containing protein
MDRMRYPHALPAFNLVELEISMSTRHAFTLPELIAVIAIIAVAAAIAVVALPLFGTSCGGSRPMQNNTQLRGIHQSLVMYAQGNKGRYPGINPDGTDGDLSVEARLQVLLEHNYFTGDYLISPTETRTAWTTGTLTTAQYCYAILQLPAAGGRRNEWRETLNTEAPVLGDRNVGTAAAPYSVWTAPASGGGWRGTVAWNDNHVAFESTHVLKTAYDPPPRSTATQQRFPNDHLFDSPGNDDALLIHSGNGP